MGNVIYMTRSPFSLKVFYCVPVSPIIIQDNTFYNPDGHIWSHYFIIQFFGVSNWLVTYWNGRGIVCHNLDCAWVGQFSIFGGSAPKKENGIFEFCSFQVTVFLFEFIVKRFIVKIYVVLWCNFIMEMELVVL